MLDTTRQTTRTELGSIKKASFGFGGYQDAMIGLSITLGGKSWGCGDFKGEWSIERTEHCKWTEESRLRGLGEACMFLCDLLKKARVNSVADLAGVPIEAMFDSNKLVSWRVLEEVL